MIQMQQVAGRGLDKSLALTVFIILRVLNIFGRVILVFLAYTVKKYFCVYLKIFL